ncbi:MAG: SIR2 family protein [Candidatus Thiodiazotropha taylori]
MNLSGVDFPQSIIDAVNNDRLVIFAGAGVSMGVPSKLPSFWELANDLAAGTGLNPKELGKDGQGELIYEPLDQFLGRLPTKDLSLREHAAELTNLGNPHNQLHESLVRVFGNPINLRVVTTNYDLMFESAASSLWADPPEIYSAPALPIGSNFRGVVHIHGSVSRPFGMVLTDGDFGRAYLTEGWARRFLVDVFSNDNIILFVGYSYEDTVLQYLARALPDRSEKNRFALLGGDESTEKWHSLGILPIVFKKAEQNDYSGLYLAVKELADFATRIPSEWQDKIGRIAENSPGTADIEDEDVIRSAIKEASHTRFFTQRAADPDWIPWLIAEGAFAPLFEVDDPEERTVILADWLIETFINALPDHVIQVLASDRRPVRFWFWWRLVLEAKDIEECEVFARIFDYLVQTKPWNADIHALQFLGERCSKCEDVERLLIVFKLMAETHISIRKPYSFEGESRPFRHELEMVGRHWNLEEIWKLLANHHETHSEAILGVCEEMLLSRKAIGTSWWRLGITWDFDSHRRSAIEPHEQDNYPKAIDVVINAAREALVYLGEHAPDYTEYWMRTRENSKSNLIRRLAVHTIGQVTRLNVEQKIHLLLSKGIFNKVHRQESFMLLNRLFPDAVLTTKQAVISEILAYQDNTGEYSKQRTAQVQFDWLTALVKSDPSCTELHNALGDIQSKYADLEESKYPGLNTWMEVGDYTPESPYSANTLLAEDGPDFDTLLNFNAESSPLNGGPSKSGLSTAIHDAAERDQKWGFNFINYLSGKEDWDNEYFPDLLRAVGKWPEAVEDAQALLNLLKNQEIQKYHSHIVADIVLNSVRNEGVIYICDVLPRTNEIADSIGNLMDLSSSSVNGDGVSWFDIAINTTEGRLAEYWIHALSIQVNKCGERVFEEPYRTNLESLVDSTKKASMYTIPVVTQQLAFLYGVDENWVREKIAPLFEFERDEILSQAWDGYLYSNAPRKEQFKLLECAFAAALDKVGVLFKEKRGIGLLNS